MKKKKETEVQINELFMAKSDWNHCFHGTIKRGQDEKGNPVVFGKILVKARIHDGYMYAKASDQWQLGEMLDEMALMILDQKIHSHAGISVKICDVDFFLN